MSEAVPPRLPRSDFVSIIAWLGIISAASGIVLALVVLPWQPDLRWSIGVLSAVVAATTSLSLRKRREWARQGFMGFLAYSSLMGIVGGLRWWVPHITATIPPAGAAPAMTQAQLDALTISMRTPLLVVAGIGAAINLLIILKLRSRLVREECDAASAV